MRLHSLSITAFGPFAETVDIDFDTLSDSGLFLLSGPTGAGKSSVLDAVCFALYGDVPGDRSTAGRLRCDQAATGVAPRVRLDVTLSGRRFRIERTPRWERPKKRGSGLTTEQASVAVSERLGDGCWQPLSTRLDETGQLVSGLVGLNLIQFCQVAMLPQGRFQAFLRARSEDRHALLRQVFRTGRFDRIEQWLRERRLELQRASAAHGRSVAHLLERVSETSTHPLPAEWDVADLSLEATGGSLTGWVERHLAMAETSVLTTAAASAEADTAVLQSTAALAAGRIVSERQAAHVAASAWLAAHDAAALDDLRLRLHRAERAEPLAELDRTVEEDAGRVERLRHEAAAVTASWLRTAATDQVPATADGWSALLAASQRSLDHADAAQAEEDRLHEVARTCDEIADLLRAACADAHDLASELEAAPALLREAETALAEARDAQLRLPALETTLRTTRQRASAARELLVVEPALERARRDRDAARERLTVLKETWLEVREARLEGMAAEIAGALAVGGSCPVCGSHEHPRPAVTASGSPDATAERAARKDVDDAESVMVALDDQLRRIETHHTRLLTLAGGASAEDSQQAAAAALQAHADATTLAAEGAPLSETVARLRATGAELQARREHAVQHQADLESRLRLHRAEHDRLADLITRVLDGTGCDSTSALGELLRHQHAALAQACTSHEQLALAERDLARSQHALAGAALAAGFTSVVDARTARLDETERRRLAVEISEADDALRTARAVSEDPDHRAAARLSPPDLGELDARSRDAQTAARAAHADHDEAARRHDRLSTLVAEVTEALAAWSPVCEELETTSRLALLVEGRSADNALQMRLSAYVLAHRLSQVVAAANERLARMSDQRYSLEHTDRRGAGETRGGLSLLVRDDWSGEARDPATLSGGETFVVSLALALGLADVITQEAGGADLDTLFVDEGFGSLDADTLDDVMDTLDGLRDGGRVVGVVSHVAEMQTRIPSQLRVTKARGGSRASVTIG